MAVKVGVNLPAMLPEVDAARVLDWARRIDAGPFSSVGCGERIPHPSLDILTTLAATATVTQRVRLVTTILVLPLHDERLVAKQAATIDHLSGGRLTLGVGVGGRTSDYALLDRNPAGRRKRMAEQVERMRALWCAAASSEDEQANGPPPLQDGGPPVLVGATSERSVVDAARWADGVYPWSFGGDARAADRLFRTADRAWTDAERPRPPRRLAGWYFALGADADMTTESFVRRYHAHLGPSRLDGMLATCACTTVSALRDRLQAFDDIGAEEVVLTCTSGDTAELDRLADAIG